MLPYDIIKVFHFIGARNKKHYMYKQITDNVRFLGKNSDIPYREISHLSAPSENIYNKGCYLLLLDGSRYGDYEIVQGYGLDGIEFTDREKIKSNIG